MIWFTFTKSPSFVCSMCQALITRQGDLFYVHGWSPDEITKMRDPWGFVYRILKLETYEDIQYIVGEGDAERLVCSNCMHSHARQIDAIIAEV